MDRHLDRIYAEPHHLFEAGDEVASLMVHPGWLHITRLLEYEIATIDATLDGRDEPLTRSQYASYHGRRSGLRAFQAAADAIIARAEREYARQVVKHEGGAESPLNGDGT
jgi:hypothetical protein